MGAVQRFLPAALLLVAALLPAVTSAHQLRAAMSTVLFNERSARIEVMHRFFVHDAEHVAGEIAGRGADLLDDPGDRQRFAIYVHERFHLFAPDGERLPLTLRGAEIDGDFLWVYQAMPLPSPPLSGISISHSALRELWPDQVNTVNVEHAGRLWTLEFRDTASRLTVDFSAGPKLPATP